MSAADPPWTPRDRRATAIGLGLILLAAAATYAIWLRPIGFVEDDFCWLEDARRSLSDPAHLFTLHISGFLRPVVHACFAANYAVAGLSPLPYYLVNILLEFSCVALVARLAAGCGLRSAAVIAAAAAFAFHGTHHEIIGWVSARTTSLWALFGLAAMIAWLNWRSTGRRSWHVASVACFAAALLCKEEAVALLPILAAADWLLVRDPRHAGGLPRAAGSSSVESLAAVRGLPPRSTARADDGLSRRGRLASTLLALLPHAALAAAYLALQWRLQTANLLVRQGGYGWHADVLANWLYRVPTLFLQFHVRNPLDAVAYSLGGLLPALWLFRGAPREAGRTALFGLALALLALAPTASFRGPEPGHLAGRYSYFASAGAALVVGAMVQAALHGRRRRTGAACVTAALLLTLLVTQHHQLRGGLTSWRDKAARGSMLFASFERSELLRGLAAESPRAVRVADAPMGLAHLRSALWLAAGIDPETVYPIEADLPDDPARGDRRVAVMRWREDRVDFERLEP